MSDGKPRWRKVFDRVERKVGQPLEDLVASRRYTNVTIRGKKVQDTVGGTVSRVARGAVEGLLHVVQIPTRSDVRRLNRQVTALAKEVRTLRATQDEGPLGAADPDAGQSQPDDRDRNGD